MIGATPIIIIDTLTSGPPADTSKRALDRSLKAAHQVMGEHWDREFLPLHFRSGNASRYKMQQRSPEYHKKKIRLASRGRVRDGGHVNLVFSGLLRRALTGFRNPVRAFPSRATIYLNGPSYFKINPKNPRMPNMANEVKAVTEGEKQTLAAVSGKALSEALVRETARTHTRTRTKP